MTTFVEPKSTDEFHRRRRMFAIVNGTLQLAPENWPYTHVEWLAQDRHIKHASDPAFVTMVRGFYLPGWCLVAYEGLDFEGWKGTVDALRPHLSALQEQLSIPGDTLVFVGMRPTGKVLREPQKRVGKLEQLLEPCPPETP